MTWLLWRDGADAPVAFDDRIAALAASLAGGGRVEGPPGPVCGTDGDVYDRVCAAGERMRDAGRSLATFLHAWWTVARPLAGRGDVDRDTVAAMIDAAAAADPAPLPAAWRTAAYAEDDGFAGWEAVVLSQLADLADFADAGPLYRWAELGVDAPRPAGARRATNPRWFNFGPVGYLECACRGGFLDVGDRVGWDDLAALAWLGQNYE